MSGTRVVGGRCWVPQNRWDLVDAGAWQRPVQSVAVVIPYFEQPESLRRMYGALAHLDPGVVEVAVVDDGSRVAPPAPPAGFPLPIQLLTQDDGGCRPGAARNLGVAATSADVIVCLDADTLPGRDTVMHLARWPNAMPDALVVGRRRHVDLTGWSPAATESWLDGGTPPPVRPDPAWLDDGYRATRDLLDADERSYRYVISAVMACHRELWEDIDGFDATRDEYGGDDWEFAYRAFNNGAVLVHDRAAVGWHDEPDWAERTGGSKDPETMWLASVIPEPLTRGGGLLQPWADTIVEITADDVDSSALAVTVAGILTAVPDCRIRVPTALPDHVRRYFAHDPRIHDDAGSARHAQRARRVLTVERCIEWAPGGLRRALEDVGARHLGRLELTDGRDLVATVTTTRALGRQRRADPTIDVVADLFGCERADVATYGGGVVSGSVDLAATFGGW